jgi:putative intracellular protease/amidase
MQYAGALVVLGAVGASPGAAQQAAPTSSSWFSGELEVSCDAVGAEGLQIVMVAGVARNDRDALVEAQKNAVKAMLFRGVTTSVCTVPPMLRPADITPEANSYFTRMFTTGGTYLSYIAFTGDQVETRIKVGRQIKVGSTIVVSVTRLRQDLEQAGILRALGSEFRRP